VILKSGEISISPLLF